MTRYDPSVELPVASLDIGAVIGIVVGIIVLIGVSILIVRCKGQGQDNGDQAAEGAPKSGGDIGSGQINNMAPDPEKGLPGMCPSPFSMY